MIKNEEMNENVKRLFADAIPDTKWMEEAQWRIDNEKWLDISGKIALKVLRTLRKKGVSQKELAEKMGVSPQYVNKIVKGSENLSLETITKLETALDIQLIEVTSFIYEAEAVPTGGEAYLGTESVPGKDYSNELPCCNADDDGKPGISEWPYDMVA